MTAVKEVEVVMGASSNWRRMRYEFRWIVRGRKLKVTRASV